MSDTTDIWWPAWDVDDVWCEWNQRTGQCRYSDGKIRYMIVGVDGRSAMSENDPRKPLQKDIDELVKEYEDEEPQWGYDGSNMNIDSFEIEELQPLELNLPVCPCCKGSGTYQGLGPVEHCKTCDGLGHVEEK